MTRTKTMLQYFFAHRNVTQELIKKIAEDNYDYKPTPTSMSAQELSSHIVTSFFNLAATAKRGDTSAFAENREDSPNILTLAEQYTENTKDLLATFSDEEFDRVVDLTNLFGMKLSGRQLLQLAMDHEIHHKGALFVYVRALGHTELPMFIQRV